MRHTLHATSVLIVATSLLAGAWVLEGRAIQGAAQAGAARSSDADRTATSTEIKEAEHDVPLLAEVLVLKPGMTVADVGAGHGAMTIVMSRWLGPSGRLYATDVAETALAALRDAKTREGLENVTVLQGAAGATNLPEACCDGIFVRNVYHHVAEPAEFNRSLVASLRPGGRLAIIDFRPRAGSELPQGVPNNRGGHGVPPSVVEKELQAAGLVREKTIARWPPKEKRQESFLLLFRRPA